MNRRDFAKQLLMAAVGSQLIDVEQLFWVPKTMITVPSNYMSSDAYVLGVLRRVRYQFEMTTFSDTHRKFIWTQYVQPAAQAMRNASETRIERLRR